jgi:hypothetical protein
MARLEEDGVQCQVVGSPVQTATTLTAGGHKKGCGNQQRAERQQEKSSLHKRKLLYSTAKLHLFIDISPFCLTKMSSCNKKGGCK